MLDSTEQHVAVRDIVGFAIGDETFALQTFEGCERAVDAQAGLRAAPNELQRLDEEFRLANPTPPELEIADRVGAELHS
jgi:hypothetical protein